MQKNKVAKLEKLSFLLILLISVAMSGLKFLRYSGNCQNVWSDNRGANVSAVRSISSPEKIGVVDI